MSDTQIKMVIKELFRYVRSSKGSKWLYFQVKAFESEKGSWEIETLKESEESVWKEDEQERLHSSSRIEKAIQQFKSKVARSHGLISKN